MGIAERTLDKIHKKNPKIDRVESCTYITHMIPSNLSPFLDPIGNNQRWGVKRERAERGRESLVKWNLVTDASEGSAAPAGEDGDCCACLRGRALMYTHAQYSCVCKIAQETDRT